MVGKHLAQSPAQGWCPDKGGPPGPRRGGASLPHLTRCGGGTPSGPESGTLPLGQVLVPSAGAQGQRCHLGSPSPKANTSWMTVSAWLSQARDFCAVFVSA